MARDSSYRPTATPCSSSSMTGGRFVVVKVARQEPLHCLYPASPGPRLTDTASVAWPDSKSQWPEEAHRYGATGSDKVGERLARQARARSTPHFWPLHTPSLPKYLPLASRVLPASLTPALSRPELPNLRYCSRPHSTKCPASSRSKPAQRSFSNPRGGQRHSFPRDRPR